MIRTESEGAKGEEYQSLKSNLIANGTPARGSVGKAFDAAAEETPSCQRTPSVCRVESRRRTEAPFFLWTLKWCSCCRAVSERGLDLITGCL